MQLEKIAILKEITNIVLEAKNIKTESYDNLNLIDKKIYDTALEVCKNEHIEKQKSNGGKLFFGMYLDFMSNLFIAYLDLAYTINEYVMDGFVLSQINIDEYLENIINKYEAKVNFKYIPSSVLKIGGSNFDSEEGVTETPFIEINKSQKLSKIKLVGYAGVGKSTTLEYIEYQDAKNYKEEQKIPVIINLILVENYKTIYELIAEKLNIKIDINNSVKFLIAKNKINLYIDGVNEVNISDNKEKRKFLDDLDEFLNEEKNKELKVIVTDRDNNEVSILNNKSTFIIQGMRLQDIEAFIDGNTEEDKKQIVKEKLIGNKIFDEKNIHPIMLKNLITIVECGKELPEDLSNLSEIYLEALIIREKEEKKEPLAEYIEDALISLVKAMNEKDEASNISLSAFTILDIFNKFANGRNIDSNKLLELLTKMGILKEVEMDMFTFADESFYYSYYYKAFLEE